MTGQGTSFINNSLAKWTHNGTIWLFLAAQKWRGAGGGIAAWTYQDRKLTPVWKNENPATVPVLAGGLLYAYDGNKRRPARLQSRDWRAGWRTWLPAPVTGARRSSSMVELR